MFTGGSYNKPPAYKRRFTLRSLVPRSKDHNRCNGHPPSSTLSRTAWLASPVPHFWLTRTLLLRWPYLQTPPIMQLAPPCSSVSATLGNPWISIHVKLSHVHQKYSMVSTITSSWQGMMTSSTSNIWSKAAPLSSLRIKSLSRFPATQIHAHHDNSVTKSLLDNSLLTPGMSQGKTML